MERNYTTQMDAARRGIVTKELETVARKECMSTKELLPLVACGKVAIPGQTGCIPVCSPKESAPCCAPRLT